MFSARARCHFCGSRSTHTKGTREFQCASCEALNFFDERGNVVDTPATVVVGASQPEERPLTFTKPLPEALGHQQHQAFCRTCQQNQHLYNETLGNYLPDESDPLYKQYEAAIPQYKKELEKRYPLVCKKCAPMAQSKIERSDYYGLAQNASRLIASTRARNGQPAYRTRDDTSKKMMRTFYNTIGLALFIGLLTQVTFHLYALFSLYLGTAFSEPELLDMTDFMTHPSLNECAQQSARLHFSSTCFNLLSNLIPYSLALAACGLWYNTGLKHWHHHTYRMEAITGQGNYFWIQVMTLAVRAWAWYNLSDPSTTAIFTKEQLIATHGFVMFFIIITQLVAQRGIRPVRWSMKGKMMPKPSDQDILGVHAGPAPDHLTPKASEKDPFRYLHHESPGPLEVISEITKRQQKQQQQRQFQYSRSSRMTAQQPSPDYSDDEDAMETDDQPVMRSSQRIANQHTPLQPRGGHHTQRNASTLSFGGDMSNRVYDMQTQMRAEQERMRVQQQRQMQHQPSPFYGRLPPAPMSMERRLRNPVIVPQEPAQVPLSQQPDFMSRMRAGVKPVQFPEKGSNLQPKPSTWTLPSDSREIGIEDRFSNTFSLNDPTPAGQRTRRGGMFSGFFGR